VVEKVLIKRNPDVRIPPRRVKYDING